MRIVCPSCQAAYEVPDKLLAGPPRKVRCARCGSNWLPTPDAAAPPTPPPQPDPPEPPDAPPPQPEPAPPSLAAPPPPVLARTLEKLAPEAAISTSFRGTALLAGLAWAASAAALFGAGWAGLAFRAEIMALWAPSRRLYAWLGLG